ncbi:MAG: glycine zipper family protein, partial [Burkholderiales bacterium]|nr:glycine zipper family protein [Burkholderiales bacterium]
MKSSTRVFSLCAAPALVLVLAGCAGSGAGSASATPVLYPNAMLNRAGDAQGRMEVGACMSRAQASGLSPMQTTNEVGRRAGEGAATAGVASAVGALITGRGGEG